MDIFLAIFTYFSYVFIIVMYTIKAVKYLKLPVHLRWELYPVIHEENHQYGGSYFEKKEWWVYPKAKSLWRALRYLLRDYLYFESYLKRDIIYWFFLYLSHIGFIMLIFFQLCIMLSAILSIHDFSISYIPAFTFGYMIYFITQFAGCTSFIAGIAGNIGLFILRLSKPELKQYTSLFMYCGYWFHIILSLVGLLAWCHGGYDFIEYRKFWEGLFTFHFAELTPPFALFIFLMSFHLIYLPFTKATHYITRPLAFFMIRWDDEPNRRGGELEKRLIENLQQRISWSGPHIKTGKRWNEQFNDGGP